ncbi:MAG: hypothetical protein MUW56_20675 [Chryseobacterium sp.]|uniref:hypothetical protein n=1 Tax=Chryseobacterium sp. TaxID=1871047 RepID=UPI0025BF82F2|nr:hypothetical protein [Chryseobacterium sp.]MCJ7935972.1 hypothetical protein [Chryseobacterium sp.]
MEKPFKNSQDLQNIFGEEIKSLLINAQGKKEEYHFPLIFFDKKVKNESIVITHGRITSLSFFIDAKESSDVLQQIVKEYQSPQLALDSPIFPEYDDNDEHGDFGFGQASSKDVMFEKAKLDSYYYLVWEAKDFIINYYKPESDMNDSSDAKIEIMNK